MYSHSLQVLGGGLNSWVRVHFRQMFEGTYGGLSLWESTDVVVSVPPDRYLCD